MKTGFYNLKSLTKRQLKSFYKDAINLAYDVHIDILDCNSSFRRQRSTDKTVGEMIENCNAEFHNVCINRSIQYNTELYGEIGYCQLTSPDYFLYIFVTLDNLEKLVLKYKLEMK